MSTPTRPRLIKHHGYRSWTSTWRDDSQSKRTKRFGREGEITRQQAHAMYAMWIETEWRNHEHVRNPGGSSAQYLISQLAIDFTDHAAKTFTKHGRQTSHAGNVRYAMQALDAAYGPLPACSLESPQLAALRDSMIKGTKRAKGEDGVERDVSYIRSMKTVNDRLTIIKEAFAWARERGLVPRNVLLDLQTVARLRKSRSEAKDSVEVKPVAWQVVEDTLTDCTPSVAALVKTIYFTGARPGEICPMKLGELDMSGEVWLYRPSSFKMEHKEGSTRVIPIGPRAKEALAPLLPSAMAGYVFSPSRSAGERREIRAASRKTPEGRGNGPGTNRVEVPSRSSIPGPHFTEASLRRAIHRACDRLGIEPWNPNQLRHGIATEARRVIGLDAAASLLGHTNSKTTEIYAAKSIEQAIQVARKVG